MQLEDRKQSFIDRAKKIHSGENLDYSEVEYISNRIKVKVIDRDLRPDGTEYGEYWITPSNHLKGKGHPDKRGKKISHKKRMTREEVIKRFMEVHKGENLDYSEVVYEGMHAKVKIIDHDLRPDGTEYGEYLQEPCVHLKGCGHPLKGIYKVSVGQTSNTDEFISKGKIVHSDKGYDYSLVRYVNNRTKVKIICPKHGAFEISPDNFLMGKGCPKCGNHLSTGEDFIYNELVGELGDGNVIKNCHDALDNGKEIDIYVPSYKFGIEFNGLRWHSEQFGKDRHYHLDKKEKCAERGINLIHVFEDEYLYHKEALMSKIRHMLGLNKGLKRIAARKCDVRIISDDGAVKEFLDKNHIQGYCSATVHMGLFFDNELVSVMSFTKVGRSGEWILSRFASDVRYIVQGGAGKLFKWFVDEYDVVTVKTFLDRRYENGKEDNLYDKLGFVCDGIVKPNYRYTNGHGERIHKFNFRKGKLIKKYGFDEAMTESEMAKELGYYKIWDCGLIRYVWKRN